MAEPSRVSLLAAIALTHGAGIALGVSLAYLPLTTTALAAAGLSLILWVGRRKGASLPLRLGLAVALLAGMAHAHLRLQVVLNPPNIIDGQEVLVEGTVIALPEKRPDGRLRLTLRLSRMEQAGRFLPAFGSVRVTVAGRMEVRQDAPGWARQGRRRAVAGAPMWAPIHYGDRLQSEVVLFQPRGFLNFGTRDLAQTLSWRGVVGVGFIRPERVILRLGNDGNPLIARTHAWREWIQNAMEQSLEGPARALAQAMILGIPGAVTPELRERFVVAGVAHLLAISGAHLGLLAAVSYAAVWGGMRLLPAAWLLRLSLRVSPYKAAALLTAPLVLFYASLAGGRIPTLRALVMILVYLGTVLLDRGHRLLHALALAGLLIILWDPLALFDLSFQLSFLAVLAIALALSWWYRNDPLDLPTHRWGERLRLYALVTLAATLGTAPLLAYYFYRISLVGLAANMVVIPWTGVVVIPLGLLGSVLSLIQPEPVLPLAGFIQPAFGVLDRIVDTLAKPSWASRSIPSPPQALIVLYYGVWIWFLGRRPVRRRWRFAVPILALVVIVGMLGPRWQGESTLRLTFLDVGQGDGTVVQFPNGQTLLVDGGGAPEGRPDPGRLAVIPSLLNMGIRRLDWVAITHPDLDHIGGLREVLRVFPVGELWHPGQEPLEGAYAEILDMAGRRGIPIRTKAYRPQPMHVGNTLLYFLHPPEEHLPYSPRGLRADTNNRSLVLRLVYGQTRALLTGDVEEEAERELLTFGPLLQADVLKVPHHGSRTSSTPAFLAGVQPKVAVASAGRSNRFGHPHPATQSRYKRMGTLLLRTDRDGAVRAASDGRQWTLLRAREQEVHPLPLRWPPDWSGEIANLRRTLEIVSLPAH